MSQNESLNFSNYPRFKNLQKNSPNLDVYLVYLWEAGGTGNESAGEREPEARKNLWLTACEAGADRSIANLLKTKDSRTNGRL